jgi:hypothetical protein
MRAITVLALGVALVALAACGNTYHPDYHPVTVTTYEQHVAYPPGASRTNAPPGPVFSTPPPQPPPTPAPWSAWPEQ